MKKVALFGTMALLCAVACEREAQVVDNPNYNSKTKEVTAEFVMSIATNRNAPTTKMTQADVQEDGSFRGMDRVHLLTYNVKTHGGYSDDHFVFADTSRATRDYDLSTVLVANEISSSQSSKVLEMSLPLQTNAVVLYGIAPRTKSKDDQGAVTGHGTPQGNQINTISFTLDTRMTDQTGFNEFTDLLGRILTGILRSGKTQFEGNPYCFWWPTEGGSGTIAQAMEMNEDPSSFIGTDNQPLPDGATYLGYTLHKGDKSWRDYGVAYKLYKAHQDDPAYKMQPMEEMMGDIYTTITTINSDAGATELRAGSAQAVFRLSEDVYQFLLQVEKGAKTSWKDYLAGQIAEEVHNRAKQFFYEEDGEMVWRPLDGVYGIKAMVDQYIPDRTWAANYSHVTDVYFNRGAEQPGFPLNLGLPAGAALMEFMPLNVTTPIGSWTYDVVKYLTEIPAYGMGAAAIPVENYRYPAEVIYWTTSSLRTTEQAVSSASYPKTVDTWDIDSWEGWERDSKVKSTTRGVAITKEINYGSALLKAKFKYGNDVIHDNNSFIHPGEADNAINVEDNLNQFKVTGLIIGGVDDKVGWNFLSVNNDFTNLVYDRFSATNQFYIPKYGTTSAATYTLTWDNYNSTLIGDDPQNPLYAQSPVYVAIEFVNNTGKDIWGGLNLIRRGGTFYVVGKLDPTAEGVLKNLPKKANDNTKVDLSRKNFNYPPFDANGNTISVPRVFMQDYVTEVTFSFNKHSLRNAYVTMPDLRASNVSLGLSVDLEWKSGLSFSDIPLGGDQVDND